VEVLKTVARQRMHANQDTLDLDDGRLGDDEAPIVSSRARHLWEVLVTAYELLGLDQACGGTDSSDNARADEREAAHTALKRVHDHSQRPYQKPERRPSGPSAPGR
jgi:hypothetical protein